MHAFYVPVVFAAAVAALAVRKAAPEPPIAGYSVEEASWEIEVFPGQIETFNGTVQEAVAQATALNPDYMTQFNERISAFEAEDAAEAAAAATAAPEPRSLGKREVHCNYWPKANHFRLNEGVNYLRSVGGRPRLSPGVGNCQRVSCSWSAAIWLCNDQNYEFHLDNWGQVANSAKHGIDTCRLDSILDNLSAQNFESGTGTGHWNTIARNGEC